MKWEFMFGFYVRWLGYNYRKDKVKSRILLEIYFSCKRFDVRKKWVVVWFRKY